MYGFINKTINRKEMKINKIFILMAIVTGMLITSCEDYLEPENENRLTGMEIKSDPKLAEGVLLKAYRGMPTGYNFLPDIASDDAITNNESFAANDMVSGGWTSSDNPLDQWGGTYEMFLYLNTFMEIAPEVEWDWTSKTKNDYFAQRLMGEAYALRAWWGFNLLQAHAGMSGGELLGYPIITEVTGVEDEYKLPRDTYADCINQILSDLDEAIGLLPLTWEDESGNPEYNSTMGARNTNRINGISAKALKSRVLLYAASPSYNSSGITWNQAAQAAAVVMDDNGGLGVLDASDLEFYKDYQSSEILWASSRAQNQSNWEEDNFPPSKFGKAQTNPTQDLVNIFPMLDGTPISGDLQDSVSQYENRDPRLAKYVVYNGANFGGSTISIADEELNIDAPGRSINATRSGYYLKKFINEGVSIDPGAPTVGKDHFYTYARYTEVLLNFAEAANEAQGPDASVNGYSAREVVNAIRTRAGISSTSYIDGLDKDGLRMAIKNERRIELCFEGHRFWDIRRWNDKADMKSSVSGVKISADNTSATISVLENQSYQDHQIYGPIPYNETLKYDIKQNDGWQ